MLSLLNQFSKSRISWFLLFFSAISLEISALFFQHVLGLPPCTLCIYQRIVIFGFAVAGLIGIFAPKRPFFKIIAIFIWLYSAFKGFSFSYFQARLQFEPSFTDTCAINPEFPSWLPLDQWLPSIFKAYGYCSDKLWSFLTIEMSQWMIIIFTCYFLVGILIFVSQFFNTKK